MTAVTNLGIDNVRAWTGKLPVEGDALKQLRNISTLPILAGHVAVMPDVHLGKGATVGSVIPTRGALIPAAVGVDIGCGMCAVRVNLRATDLPDNLAPVRRRIEQVVPVGFAQHDEPPQLEHFKGRDSARLVTAGRQLHARFNRLNMRRRLGRLDNNRVWRQVGTLGGGNHFIELCLDERDDVWVMLHSGSRNIGKMIGEAAMNAAREHMRAQGIDLPDRDLAWLDAGTAAFDDYVEALRWAQDYAATNRDVMLHAVLDAVADALDRPIHTTATAVNCHHNYAAVEMHYGEEVWITRKGAVSAREGELGIIPGSMGARSYIVRGKGHAAAYHSCSHGAGRVMSRSAAKRRYSAADLIAQTEGVECRKDAGVVDEIPAAYKDIKQVMAAQRDLVEVVHTLKQVLCVKG